MKYHEKIIQIKRVTKVIKGGKKITFRAIIIIGNMIDTVGLGIGCADDNILAIEKAIFNGKKNLTKITLNCFYSISSLIKISYGASKILLRPALLGTGIKASGSVRTVLELAGIKNIVTKQLGSRNVLNNAKATLLALKTLNN
jgi:small subunit ribosomal protein S5